MIIIAGYLEFVDQQNRDGAVAAGTELQQATRDGEPGCLSYVFTADPCDERRVHVHELWSDEAALAAHFAHPNYTAMRTVLRGFARSGGDVRKYRCDLSEPVYDDSGVARADFFTA